MKTPSIKIGIVFYTLVKYISVKNHPFKNKVVFRHFYSEKKIEMFLLISLAFCVSNKKAIKRFSNLAKLASEGQHFAQVMFHKTMTKHIFQDKGGSVLP
jgi:hypothetical protein